MLDTEARGMRRAGDIHPDYQASARNLSHYLALRRVAKAQAKPANLLDFGRFPTFFGK